MGLLLVDVARHAARAYSRESEYTEERGARRILDMFDAEIARPTDLGSAAPRSRGALSVVIEHYHYDFMAEAIREAEHSIAQGGLPIGAVLTRDDKIVARGHNNRVQENVILHGEMTCLRDAGVISFHDTVMYTTLSPCSMCGRARAVQGLAGRDRGVRHLSGQQGHSDKVRRSLSSISSTTVDQHDEVVAIRSRQRATVAGRYRQLMRIDLPEHDPEGGTRFSEKIMLEQKR